MPSVNWGIFEGLPGAVQSNFEMLCRGLIRRHYARHGDFVALAAQPGVEFHLKLHSSCTLGDPGRWYGWQCRWFDLPGGRAIGTARRTKIAKAIATTEREVPGITDWILWTRRSLTKGDQEWFLRLKTRMRLQLWTAVEVEDLLSGDAEILRHTYFGELVLTADALAELQARSMAPIQRRWQPAVHQATEAERMLLRKLGEATRWDNLRKLAGRLEVEATLVDADLADLVGPIAEGTAELADLARQTAAFLSDVHTVLGEGDLDLLRQHLARQTLLPSAKLGALPRQLRAKRHRAALSTANSLADVRLADTLLEKVEKDSTTRLVGVIADAGFGKTELAAQLTAAMGDRPAGILLHGRDLHAGHNLNDLARQVVVQGTPIQSIEALVAAVDAAGQRAHRRIPIVIDALNEAEDPRDWRSPLGALDVVLQQYPYVLLVCTVRTAFVEEALPPSAERLEIPGFGRDTVDAIRKYFDYYRINAADAELPVGLLSHPLTLRLFCEVTNPKRERVVGIESMPGSLTALFDRYLAQAAERIADLSPHSHRYYAPEVQAALEVIGTVLWEGKARGIEVSTLRRRLGDEARPWNESIVRALEHEGILLRIPGSAPTVGGLYDALAGHLIADALLAEHGRTGMAQQLNDKATLTALNESSHDQHPLGGDTLRALIGLMPRRLYGQQLWPLIDEPLRSVALVGAADLEGQFLDGETVRQLAIRTADPPSTRRDILDRLTQTRGSSDHPLNAEFLDAVLRPMSVADRDFRWTEWVRRHRDDILADLVRLEKRWQGKDGRVSGDELRARWVLWLLTSTVRQIRDHASRTLYWFGRRDPAALFDLTIDALAINDPYISERLLGVSYGVCMAHQLPDPLFEQRVRPYLTRLLAALTGSRATHPTSHWLARLYVQGSVNLALSYHPAAVPKGLQANGRVPFSPGPKVQPIAKGDSRAREVDLTFGMDFENYTIGSLFDDRRNYDMEHSGHQDAVAHVRGTVWELGWRESGLGTIDKDLVSGFSRNEQARTERYGKKYGWIGFYTFAGMLEDDGRLPAERLSDLQLDPSFPERPLTAPFELPVWARAKPSDDRRWISRGVVTVPDELLYRSAIDTNPGPWLAVHGHLYSEGQAPGRRVFGYLSALLVARRDADKLARALFERKHPGVLRLQEVPEDYYTFAGEIPWSSEFGSRYADGEVARLYRRTVDGQVGGRIEVEILAHRYAWESYHSSVNEAGGALVPSWPVSKRFDLRAMPQSFTQALPVGTAAALSLSAPKGFGGHLLYLREDLLRRYAGNRRLLWFIWGERELYPYLLHHSPDWLTEASRQGADVWRNVRRGEELSKAFAVKDRSRGPARETPRSGR